MKVLIIDDEPSVRRALERAFGVRGHEAYAAADAIAGEAVWKKQLPDIVIVDVLMPKVTGPQLLEKLKEFIEGQSVKIILISAYGGEFDTKLSLSKGANLFIGKPFKNIFTVVDNAEELYK